VPPLVPCAARTFLAAASARLADALPLGKLRGVSLVAEVLPAEGKDLGVVEVGVVLALTFLGGEDVAAFFCFAYVDLATYRPLVPITKPPLLG
jgi:hypothetical protein